MKGLTVVNSLYRMNAYLRPNMIVCSQGKRYPEMVSLGVWKPGSGVQFCPLSGSWVSTIDLASNPIFQNRSWLNGIFMLTTAFCRFFANWCKASNFLSSVANYPSQSPIVIPVSTMSWYQSLEPTGTTCNSCKSVAESGCLSFPPCRMQCRSSGTLRYTSNSCFCVLLSLGVLYTAWRIIYRNTVLHKFSPSLAGVRLGAFLPSPPPPPCKVWLWCGFTKLWPCRCPVCSTLCPFLLDLALALLERTVQLKRWNVYKFDYCGKLLSHFSFEVTRDHCTHFIFTIRKVSTLLTNERCIFRRPV